MTIDFAALRGDTDAPGPPRDGIRTATLVHARVFETGDGKPMLSTEWTGHDGSFWESVDTLKATDFYFKRTQELFRGLGVNLASVNGVPALVVALEAVQGRDYQVRTERNGAYTNTWVESAQTPLPLTDVPAPEVDLAARAEARQAILAAAEQMAAAKAAAADDDTDDIPFKWLPDGGDAVDVEPYNPFDR
jgi:hypothetical protein